MTIDLPPLMHDIVRLLLSIERTSSDPGAAEAEAEEAAEAEAEAAEEGKEGAPKDDEKGAEAGLPLIAQHH